MPTLRMKRPSKPHEASRAMRSKPVWSSTRSLRLAFQRVVCWYSKNSYRGRFPITVQYTPTDRSVRTTVCPARIDRSATPYVSIINTVIASPPESSVSITSRVPLRTSVPSALTGDLAAIHDKQYMTSSYIALDSLSNMSCATTSVLDPSSPSSLIASTVSKASTALALPASI